MYKYSRERLAKLFFDYEDKCDFLEDLLAQKEDRKEKHITDRGGSQSGVALTPKVRPLTIKDTKWTGCSTPSPLEGFVEMKEITDKHDVIVFGRNPLDDTFLIIKNLNQLICNQKKLYQYIKEKK